MEKAPPRNVDASRKSWTPPQPELLRSMSMPRLSMVRIMWGLLCLAVQESILFAQRQGFSN
ncbi:hypothetical protein L484_004078 [Morus notabilis]|uniref:Uncharacterized protein n=1 Tax=Morus notabilis TaxID=981085 RepID=W9QT26_9ROSA|nr:hypothetical protein L484_004078 [Morus notabilis]